MKFITVILPLLFESVISSIYTFSYPNNNGLYDIIHYDKYYTILPEPIYPNSMTDSIILYDYNYNNKDFYTVDREYTLHRRNLDNHNYYKCSLEKKIYSLKYNHNTNRFISTIYNNGFKVSEIDKNCALINNQISYSGIRPLPIYRMATINYNDNHYISMYLDRFKIKIGVYDLENYSEINVIKIPFSIFLNIHYNQKSEKLVGIKLTNGDIKYYEIEYKKNNNINEYNFPDYLGRILPGSALDPYNSHLWITLRESYKTNIVKFNIKERAIESIIPLSRNWINHLLFYPGPITTMTSAKFNKLGNQIDIEFDMSVKKWDSKFDCDLIFTKISSMGIGNTGYCQWDTETDNKLLIYPSNDAKIIPGDTLVLKKNTLQSKYQELSYSDGSIIISNNNFSIPEVIIFGPNKLSYCDKVYLDGSFTQSLDGREFKSWTWSITPIINYDGNYNSNELTIKNNILLGGNTYIFKLDIITSLGIKTNGKHSIFISNKLIPQVKIIGSKIKKSYFNRRLYLTAEVYHAECIIDDEYKKLNFQWEGIIPLDYISSKTTKLYIAPKSLNTGKIYRFYVTAVSKYITSYTATTYTDVYIAEDRLYAKISGGSNRKNPLSRKLLLDGSMSYDPDYYYGNNNIKMNYIWSCYYDNTEIDIMSQYNLETIVLPANLFNINGTYRFCLNIWKSGIESIRQDSTCVNVEYTYELYPNIQIQPLTKAKYNSNEKITLMSNSYSYVGEKLDYRWELIGENINRDDLKTDLNSINLVFKENKLIAGRLYSFRLYGKDSVGEGFSQIDLLINNPPRGGTFQVIPNTGYALNTTFSLILNSWTDEADDLPLMYNFGIGDKLLNIPNDRSRLDTVLEESKNTSTLVIGYIRDVYNGLVNVTETVIVNPYVKPINLLKIEIYESINNLLDTGDNVGAVALINKFINELENRGIFQRGVIMSDTEWIDLKLLKVELFSILEELFVGISNNEDAYIRLYTLESILELDTTHYDIIDRNIGLLESVLDIDLESDTLNKTLTIVDRLTTGINITNSTKNGIDKVLEKIVVQMISNNIPNEDPISMESDGIVLKSQKKTVDTLDSLSISNGSIVNIPGNLSLNTSVVNLDMRGLKNNPYNSNSEAEVESDILSFTIKSDDNSKIEIKDTYEPFVLEMRINNNSINGKIGITSCNYWNETIGDWDSAGCIAVKYVGDNLVCHCNHLTDFASNKPKYNAVDPVGDASTLRNISWENMTTLATLLAITNMLIVFSLLNTWKNHRDNKRLEILKSFGQKQKNDFDMFGEKKLFIEKLRDNIIDQHYWISIFTVSITDNFTRQMRLLFVFCVLIAGLTTNALFYGQDNTSLVGTIMVGIISSIIITPPTLIFLNAMKYASKVEEMYKIEREESKPQWEMNDIGGRNIGIGRATVELYNTNSDENNRINNKLNNCNRIYGTDRRVSRKNIKPIDYPYGTTVIVGAVVFYLFCSYLIMLFGIKFSGQKANYWLLSSCISTISDVLVMQPVQILAKTAISMIRI